MEVEVLHIVMHGKGIDLCCGKDKLTIAKDHPEYIGWLKIIEKHAHKEELPISKNFIESLTIKEEENTVKIEENEYWRTIA